MARGKFSEYTDSMGRFHTKALFIETIQKEQLDRGIKPKYTLRGNPKYIDIHDLFMECADPTGYSFAIRAFGSWDHLQHLRTLAWFKRYYDSWLDELEVRLRSEAIQSLISQSKDNKGTTAAKYLAERGWEKKRGRPSNEEVERERRQQAMLRDELEQDFDRVLN